MNSKLSIKRTNSNTTITVGSMILGEATASGFELVVTKQENSLWEYSYQLNIEGAVNKSLCPILPKLYHSDIEAIYVGVNSIERHLIDAREDCRHPELADAITHLKDIYKPTIKTLFGDSLMDDMVQEQREYSEDYR